MRNFITKSLLISAIFITHFAQAECNFGNVYEDLDCYEKSLAKSKTTLNTTYQKLYKKLYKKSASDTQKALEDSQKAWLNYRDKHCNGLVGAFASQAQGGGYGLIVTSCVADLTKSRVSELKSLLD